MIDFEIKSKTQPIGTRKGQTVYYAQPKSQQYFTNKMLIERIVRETSLSEGDVKNALISLSNVVCEAMTLGMSVDLAELGSFRVVVPSKMMDTPEEVTVADALKTPKIVFTPKQGRCPQNPENRLHPQAEDARCRQQRGIEHRPPQERDGFRRHYHRARQWQRWLVRIKRESGQPPRTPARRLLQEGNRITNNVNNYNCHETSFKILSNVH